MQQNFHLQFSCEQKITQHNYDYIFISPHLDDVVLSCSGALCFLLKHAKILVITLFARDPIPPFSPLAQSFHRQWEVSDAAPYAQRKDEERQAMALFGIDYVWLDWPEVLYRAPYLVREQDICNPSAHPEYDPIFPQLCHWFTELSLIFATTQFVVPFAIGTHRDHVITRQAACCAIDQNALIFYEDFPYVAFQSQEIFTPTQSHDLIPYYLDISSFLEQRIQATHQYRSQLDMLCHPPKRIEDLIRSSTRKQNEQGEDIFVERYWMTTPEQLPWSTSEKRVPREC